MGPFLGRSDGASRPFAINRRFFALTTMAVLLGSVVAQISAQNLPTDVTQPVLSPAPKGLPNTAKPSAPFNLTGIWGVVARAPGWPDAPSLTPAMEAVRVASLKRAEAGTVSFGDCFPPGFPSILTYSWPSQFIQLGDQIVVIHELLNSVRWIWLDGRQMPKLEEVGPTFNGNSIGRWEGDTLVIETANISSKSEIVASKQGTELYSLPHSEKMHVVERIKMGPDGHTFSNHLTITDPELLTKPWVTTLHYARRPGIEVAEFVCENNRGIDGSTIERHSLTGN